MNCIKSRVGQLAVWNCLTRPEASHPTFVGWPFYCARLQPRLAGPLETAAQLSSEPCAAVHRKTYSYSTGGGPAISLLKRASVRPRRHAADLRKPRSLEAVDAEIAIAEGRFEAALPHLEASQTQLDKSGLDSGLARFATEQWD